MITSNQIKAARALLDMKQTELAKTAGISVATVNNIERGSNKNPRIQTLEAIRTVLEKHGIEFTGDKKKFGVALKKKRGKQ